MIHDPARWDRIEELFRRALERDEDDREAFLEVECEDDPSLLAEVLELLEAHDREHPLLDREVGRVARDVLDGSVPNAPRFGPYRVLDVLGRGGMAVVYLAEREDLQNRVAVKVLRDAWLSPTRRARFEREERTLAQLNHPGIATLHDADVLEDGTPYFVMEYVEGVPLTIYSEERSLAIPERLHLFRAVGEAVQYAHQQAVIHRDLKPSNVLVTDDGRVRLLDFGIAKQLDGLEMPGDQTATGLAPMTPAYAAPEQFTGAPLGVYTDVYALGVILYELLAGRHPHALEGLTPGQIENRILESEPEPPSLVAASAVADRSSIRPAALPRHEWADLDVICLKAMQKDPGRRYPTVEALVRDLDHCRDGQPLEARPDTLRYRTGKFLRRNRREVAAAAAMLALSAGMLGFHAVQLGAERERALVEAEKAAQVSEYMIGLFGAGDPYAPEADEVDLRVLLERGERQAEELADQEEVKAAMLNTLGRVHAQLSDYERAEALLIRALDLRRQVGTPLEVAESLANLGGLLIDTGEYDRAEEVLREALGLRERELPANHPALAATLSDLGSVLRYKGGYAEAEALHRLAVRVLRATHAEPHEELGMALNRLAVALFQQGKYDEAELRYREALAVKTTVFGSKHAGVTRVMANLGKLYEEVGDFLRADSLLTEALRIRRATLGDDHFETAVGLGQLATLVSAMGEHERAEAYLREVLQIRERILSPTHPNIGTTLNNLASTVELQGDYDEAARLYERAADIYAESLGERHRFTAIALANLAQVHLRRGDPEEAYPHYREAVSILEEVHPENHQELAHNRSRFGGILVALGRHAEAEPLLLDAFERLAEELGADHPRTREAASRLVELYEELGDPLRAESYQAAVVGGGG